jgi:tetratricopeptide (TPR) repeat protein
VVTGLLPALSSWVGEGLPRPHPEPPLTPSFEAYRRFREAEILNGRGDLLGAIQLFGEATELDPEFGRAWISLAGAHNNLGLIEARNRYYREALKHPHRLREYERLFLQARLAGDLQAELQARERQTRETGRPHNMHGVALIRLGRWEAAADLYEGRLRRDPFGLLPLSSYNLARALLVLGRVEDARALAVNLEGTARGSRIQALIAVRMSDWVEAERIALEVVRDPTIAVTYRSFSLGVLASAYAAQGRLEAASSAVGERTGMDLEHARHEEFRAAQLDRLVLSVASDLPVESWDLEGLRGDTTGRALVLSGLWAAELGDTTLARTHLDALPPAEAGRFDTVDPQEVLTVLLRALLSARKGDWGEVERVLEPVTRDRAPRTGGLNQFPHWTLASAKEALGKPAEAATLFAGIASGVWHGGTPLGNLGLTYSFAHRRAALLYGQLGQEEEAIEHWQAFLEAFTEPDPELEWMVEEAQVELARLGG